MARRTLLIVALVLVNWTFNLIVAIGIKQAGLAVVQGHGWKENLLWQLVTNGSGFVAFEGLILLTGLTTLSFAYSLCFIPGFLIAQITALALFHEQIGWNQTLAILLMVIALLLFIYQGKVVA